VLTLPAQAQTYDPIIDPPMVVPDAPVIIYPDDAPMMPTSALELITNGGFETGDFNGWNAVDQLGSSGTLFVENDTIFFPLPLSGLPTVGPANGNWYAVSDQFGPGAYSLFQSFTVPANSNQVMLNFNMFVNNWAGITIIDPAGLDFNTDANQHARVDILTASAAPFSTAPGDVVTNLYLGTQEGNLPNPYIAYNFDLTSTLTPGQTYLLRFAEVDNQSFLNLGVDDVSILASSDNHVVPEPASTLASVLLISLGAGSTIKRKRNNQ